MTSYDRKPAKRVPNCSRQVWHGIAQIQDCLGKRLSGDSWRLVIECYPGVTEAVVQTIAAGLSPDVIFCTRDILKEGEQLETLLAPVLTEDRVFGRMFYGDLMDFVDREKLAQMQYRIRTEGGKQVICGFGASLVCQGDLLVCVDISRWEIQLRYRKGMPNYLTDNPGEDLLKKVKQGFFLEWRIGDKVKLSALKQMDYYIDANHDQGLVMTDRPLFERLLQINAGEPFRTVPYFDVGVWGGHWMEEVCGLEPRKDNYAWNFDGVPEENSLLFNLDGITLEMPAMNLVLLHPKELLGQKVYARFGAEFPIRFDFLDTMGGQNLSLQVHPSAEYIRKQFGMPYTQDESYYILDAREDSCVYLGLKEETDISQMVEALEIAQRDGTVFDAEKYINRLPAKKHDHFLIPAGTCHCSGKNTMVLEISATPYIFTFKLWDWGRLGLDGKPRPVHIQHGKHVIEDRRSRWVKENLVNARRTIQDTEAFTEEHTGLHELEFIETRCFTIRDRAEIDGHESVNMLNLVDGKVCVVESLDGSFEDYEVHYAETFIVPASVGRYRVRAVEGEIKVIQAYVRV